MKQGSIMLTAKTSINTVVDVGTKDFAIVITDDPIDHYPTYGVRNKNTLVDEYVSPSLAKIRVVVEELQKDLDIGYLVRRMPPAPDVPPGGTVPFGDKPSSRLDG